MEWLASAKYYFAIPQAEESEFIRLLESSVKHYSMVLEDNKLPAENEGFDVFEFIRCLNINRCFDPIREREEVKELFV